MTFSRIFAAKAHPNSVANTKATHAAASTPAARRSVILGQGINQALAYDTTNHCPVVLNHLEMITDNDGTYHLLANLGDDTGDCAPVMMHPDILDQFIVTLVKSSTASKTTFPSVEYDFDQSSPPEQPTETAVPTDSPQPGVERFGCGDFLADPDNFPPPKIVAFPLILPIPDIELPNPLTMDALADSPNPGLRGFTQGHDWAREHHADFSLHETDRIMKWTDIQNRFKDSVQPHLATQHCFKYTLLPPGCANRKAVIHNVQATLQANGVSPTVNSAAAPTPAYLLDHNKIQAKLASAITAMAAAATKSATTKSERDKKTELEQAAITYRAMASYRCETTDANGVVTATTVFPEMNMTMLEAFEKAVKPLHTHRLHSMFAQARTARRAETGAHFLLEYANQNTRQMGTYYNACIAKCRFNDEPIDASNTHLVEGGLTLLNFLRAKSNSMILLDDVIAGAKVERQELAEGDISKMEKQKCAYRCGKVDDPREVTCAVANRHACRCDAIHDRGSSPSFRQVPP